MMLLFDLQKIESVNAICQVCMRYKEYFPVDIVCGRYVTDGVSVLGVASMLGRTVEIKPIAYNNIQKLNEFIADMVNIGAYEKGEA